MKSRHVTKSFDAWFEGTIGDSERRGIQLHLDQCNACRRFFDDMTRVMEEIDPARLPHLEPDPFLPTRIRALDPTTQAKGAAGSAIPVRPALSRLGKSAMIVAVCAAVVAGVIFGSGLSSRVTASAVAEDIAIAGAYHEAFYPSDLTSYWEYALESAGEEEDDDP